MKYLFLIFSLFVTCELVVSVDKEMTVNIEAGREECFYESAKKGDSIDIEYQVVDGGHGDLDITFRLADPTGRILLVDFKKPENNHRADAEMEGDYRFCFDNTFSSFNTKTIFFELIIENESNGEWDSEENPDGVQPELIYELQLQVFEESLNEIRSHLKKARHFQDLIKSAESRDRNVAEENYFKVNTFSLIQLIVMLFVGIIQVVMLKSLFDDSSKVHKIWKNFDKGLR